MRHSATYTILFSGAICIVCAVLVSTSAVSLKENQLINAALDKQRNVLYAAGLANPEESLDKAEVEKRFQDIRPVVIEIPSGELTDLSAADFDQLRAVRDPETSHPAPENRSSIQRVPNHALVYEVWQDSKAVMCVVPIEGYGLWSTLYGFLAISRDGNTIQGLTYYKHGETPGLGGEVDNPRWKSLWKGRKVYDEKGNPVIRVVKGTAGPPEENPFKVDGLSGATITSSGVTSMLEFWLGEEGFQQYLQRFQEGQS